jgi:hypothetical protein
MRPERRWSVGPLMVRSVIHSSEFDVIGRISSLKGMGELRSDWQRFWRLELILGSDSSASAPGGEARFDWVYAVENACHEASESRPLYFISHHSALVTGLRSSYESRAPRHICLAICQGTPSNTSAVRLDECRIALLRAMSKRLESPPSEVARRPAIGRFLAFLNQSVSDEEGAAKVVSW